MSTNRAWILTARPEGPFTGDCVELQEQPRPTPGDGEALVRVTHLSMDPTIRGWMSFDTYMPAIPIGDVVRSFGIGEVVESTTDAYTVGDMVTGLTGWQEWTIAGDGLQKLNPLPPGTNPTDAISLFGPTGLAAYFGMLRVAEPEEGEQVLVSGAAGATGSVAGQIAKLKGCRVIGTAGGPEKCARVVEEYGFDVCLDYKADDFGAQLREASGGKLDVYFDNVGGPVLEAALANMAIGARIALCGAISQYDGVAPTGPRNYANMISKRARMQGFLISDFAAEWPTAFRDLATWAAQGDLVHAVDLSEGIESAPAAFAKLFSGGNVGKVAVTL